MDIEIEWNNFIPFSGYLAIMLFGKIWMRNNNKPRWEKYIKNGQADIATNHEMIHVKQALSANNSWWKFYLLYIWYWLKANPLFRGFTFAYKMNPFEMESYANESDLFYNNVHSTGATRWKLYNQISVKQRKKYWDEYKSKRKTEHITFSKFIQTYIDCNLNFKEFTN